jgi:hypothetical protein
LCAYLLEGRHRTISVDVDPHQFVIWSRRGRRPRCADP